jgi:hypothetical protein
MFWKRKRECPVMPVARCLWHVCPAWQLGSASRSTALGPSTHAICTTYYYWYRL